MSMWVLSYETQGLTGPPESRVRLLTAPIDASLLSWTVSGDQRLAALVTVEPAVWGEDGRREEEWDVSAEKQKSGFSKWTSADVCRQSGKKEFGAPDLNPD